MKRSLCVAMRGRSAPPHRYTKTEQVLEPNNRQTTNALTSVCKDNLILEIVEVKNR